MEIEQGVGVALGLTVDVDNDVVILIVVGTAEDRQIAAPMTPMVAASLGSSLMEMATACIDLQGEISTLEPDEVRERLEAIQKRFAAPSN